MSHEAQSAPVRERTFRWSDPASLAEGARGLAGRAFLEAMRAGTLPLPPICDLVDFAFDEIGDGVVGVAFAPAEFHYNPIGTVHGGVLSTLLDSVMGCAVHSLLPQGRGYTTLELKVNLLRPVRADSGPMRAVGRVLHLGRRTAVAEGSLIDAAGKLHAQATTTCFVFDGG